MAQLESSVVTDPLWHVGIDKYIHCVFRRCSFDIEIYMTSVVAQ